MLNDASKMRNQDKLNVIESTESLFKQCQQTWEDCKLVKLPDSYKSVNKIVLVGMGGSHLGGNFIQAVFKSSLKVPLIIESDYSAPEYIDHNTLLIACSYSGTTEEVINFLEDSLDKSPKVIVISSGGDLKNIAEKIQAPAYIFNSTHNKSKIPRYGSGYMFISLLSLLNQAGLIDLNEEEIIKSFEILKNSNEKFGLDVPKVNNPAKKMAVGIQGKFVILVASEHLVGSSYIFKNQLNESSKNFSTMFEIPELNHHLLEGLAHPAEFKACAEFVFIESNLYHSRNQKRHEITKEIIKKQGIEVDSYKTTQPTRIGQAFEILAFTSYTALYLSILNQVDPGPNPWVDYLKTTLGQSLGK